MVGHILALSNRVVNISHSNRILTTVMRDDVIRTFYVTDDEVYIISRITKAICVKMLEDLDTTNYTLIPDIHDGFLYVGIKLPSFIFDNDFTLKEISSYEQKLYDLKTMYSIKVS